MLDYLVFIREMGIWRNQSLIRIARLMNLDSFLVLNKVGLHFKSLAERLLTNVIVIESTFDRWWMRRSMKNFERSIIDFVNIIAQK